MTDIRLIKDQAWSQSLWQLMGYPTHALLGQDVNDTARDRIRFIFDNKTAEPVGVSLAIRQETGIIWMTGARLYAAAEFASIELLAGNRRWYLDSHHVLTPMKLPPTNRRARGETIAMRRWRKAAAAIEDVAPGAPMAIPSSGHTVTAIDCGQFDIAA